MGDVPVAFAFAAGLVATVNPCGFAMLPAYLSYFVGLDDDGDDGRVGGRGTAVARGLAVGAVVSAGFLVVFGVSGALVTAGFRSIIDYVPWVALAIGVALTVLGVAMLGFGVQLNVALPHLDRGGSNRGYRSMFLFGVSYAVASLSCALPVFLAVTGAASATPTFLAGVLTYVVYGLGMSMLLMVLTIALSVAKGAVVRRLRRILPYVGRLSGAILVLPGVYITVYWAANLRDPLAARGATFRTVERFQTWLTDQLGSRPELWATVFGLVLAAAVAYVVWSRRAGGVVVRRNERGAAAGSVRVERSAMPSPVPTPARVDRDEVFLEYTKSICPVCKVVVDAEINVRDNKVYLRKRCHDHGRFEALIYGDAEMYAASLRFNKPGTLPLQTQTEVHDGCPLDCGLCPDHKQHACVGLIEVNTACNLDCPVCFADSGHHPDGFSLTREQVEAGLDAFVAAEGEPEVVMFSGGEPSIHPQILEFCALARDKGIRNVVLNTNGIRLAHDPSFGPALAELGVRIYLQFDGLEEATHLALRGRDLRAAKAKALERCTDAGLAVLLVAAVEAGVNDHELGAIVRHGIDHPAVRGVVFQPVTHAGRHDTFDPRQRLTNPDVIHGLVDQCPDWFRASDFFPVPCCFPTCRSITYLLADDEDVLPIPRLLPMETYLDYLSNRALPDPSIRGALEGLWSASAIPGTDAMAERLTTALASLGLPDELDQLAGVALETCASCGIDFPDALADLAAKAFMIVIQDFQDPYTLNVRQLMKCCVEEITPDGRLIPFCAYNSVGYREQVREQLSGTPVPGVVPNAAELADLLQPTRHGSRTIGDPAAGAPLGAVQVNLGRGLR